MGSRRSFRRWLAVAAVAAIVATVTAGCSSKAPRVTDSGELGEIKSRGRLVVGIKFDLPAFSAKDPTTGRIEGFDAEIARLIATSLFGTAEGRVQFVEVVSRDREEAIRSGQVDLVVSTYTITAERQKLVAFAGPYYVAGQDILVRRSNGGDITGVDSLSGRRVCSVNGSTSLANLRRLAPEADTSLAFDRYSVCVEALIDKRVDAVTTDDAILLGFLRQNPDQLRLVGRPFTTEPYGIGVKLEAGALRNVVNEVLAKAYTDGRWKAIYEATIGKAGLSAPQPPRLDP
jgi:glutamate transport system substrate-binding protein